MGNPHSIYAARIAERSNAINLRFITYSFVGSNPTSCKNLWFKILWFKIYFNKHKKLKSFLSK